MHSEILSEKQKHLLDLLGNFSGDFCLVGGTAISLQLGHRRSIDFDLLTSKPLNHDQVRRIIRKDNRIEGVVVDQIQELTLIVDGVKITYLNYPAKIVSNTSFDGIISMPDLLTLATMKAYALGKRAKWKDYVDIYFISKKHSILGIIEKSKKIFGNEFSEKLFREQLSYFEDISYSEEINYMPGFNIRDSEIKEALKEMSLQK